MSLRFDSGFSTVLVVCEGCPVRFRYLASSPEEASRAATYHLELTHTESGDVTRVRYLAASRQRARRK